MADLSKREISVCMQQRDATCGARSLFAQHVVFCAASGAALPLQNTADIVLCVTPKRQKAVMAEWGDLNSLHVAYR